MYKSTNTKDVKKKEHILIGISPGNSYYKEQKIEDILQWVLNMEFNDFSVFAADEISYYNWLAAGYSEQEAKKKTNAEDKRLRNRIFRVFEKLNIPKSFLLTYEGLKNKKSYQEIFNLYQNKFEQDIKFRQALLDCVDRISKYQKIGINIENKYMAVNYFLAELPLLLHTPKLLEVPSSCVIYHALNPLAPYLYLEEKLQDENQGSVILIFE